jgi:hypothetical protein
MHPGGTKQIKNERRGTLTDDTLEQSLLPQLPSKDKSTRFNYPLADPHSLVPTVTAQLSVRSEVWVPSHSDLLAAQVDRVAE